MTGCRLTAVTVLVGMLGAGCSTGAKPAAVSTRTSEMPKVQLVLRPAATKPIVTFKGLVNGGKPLAVDLASFDALPRQSLTIVDPL